ncbi:MAG TPA: hypothetical protein VMT01_00515 [Candidatus Acidoferrum sp.]|nr:hypothetical protein [Candidatus Acidoferrum sp.]
MKRLRTDKRGISNVIVVMLSLVLIVIIVSNVVLWSYQMNQIDLDRMHENVTLANVTRVTQSSWFTTQSEYPVTAGSRTSGTYTGTQAIGGSYESFREEKTQIFNPLSYIPYESTRYLSGSMVDLRTDDNASMSFLSYPNYEVKYNESLPISSTTSTTYQDKVSIIFTPQVTGDFIMIATAEVQGSSTSYQAKARLTIASTTYQELLYRVKDTTDWYPFCGLKRLTLNANASYTINIGFCTSNSAATAYIKNTKLIIFSLQSEYAESEGLSTTTSTNWVDKVALTFTPPTDGDYLIVASANYRGSQTTNDVKIRLVQDDTTVYADTIGRPGSGTTANYYTFGVMRRSSINASSHSFKLQYCTSATSITAGINYAHIVAIRLSQFDSNYYVESENESVPAAANTWYDKLDNSYTATDGNFLVMGSIAYKSGSTSYSVGFDFQTESTSKQSPLVEHRDASTYESAFFITVQTLTSGSKTDKIRWMGESTNARVKNARLISCQLPMQTQTAEVEFQGSSNTQNWTQLKWTTDCSFTSENVATTLQLYDYQTNQYPTSGDGYILDTLGTSDVTENQTMTLNPTYYRDPNGNWKIKIKGVKAIDTQFELKVDWIEFETTTSDIYRLDLNGNFAIDLSAYPSDRIHGLEITIRYNVSDSGEKWSLKAYDWNLSSFRDAGFNDTGGNQPLLGEWNDYSINITDNWMNYVDSNGTLLLKFLDEGVSTNQTIVQVDFFSVRAAIDGAAFDLRNSSPMTTHIVAVWIVNSTNHQRYEANLFINSGETALYLRVDISLPQDQFIAKVVTEKGNVAVFQ